LFAPKCSTKIVVYKSTHLICVNWLKNSSISSQMCLHVINHVNCMALVTVEDRSLIKTVQIEKAGLLTE